MASGLIVKSYSSMKEFRDRKNVTPVNEKKLKKFLYKKKDDFVSQEKIIPSNGYFSIK